MVKKYGRTLLTAVLSAAAASCTFFTTPYENPPKIAVEHVEATGDLRYSIHVTGDPVDIFFSFTNVNESDGAEAPEVDEGSIIIDGVSVPAPVPRNFEVPRENRHPFRVFVEDSTRELRASLRQGAVQKNTFPSPGVPSFDVTGEAGSFTVDIVNDVPITEAATCRAVVGPVDTTWGQRTLNIWAADDCWGGQGGDVTEITAIMIDQLAERFLKSGPDNDIYDWVTTILGPEWGNAGYSNLIPMNNEITILLSDINKGDYSNGAIIGYFWPVHNFTDSEDGYPGSNERIMFVVDAVLYAESSNDGEDADATWEATDYWPEVVFSTLAHEFQHMIHFYQKYFVAEAPGNTETWINEMCSLLIEDFLADKIGVEGPRGVDPADPTAGSPGNTYGRLPSFNENLFRSVIVDYPQEFVLDDYSVAYALGAFLARGYGGADFINRVVCSPHTDKSALEYAVRAYTGGEETFERLLERWGAAIFLSDKTEAPPWYQYNSGGWFTSAAGGNEYNLGSINLYNYNPAPEFATDVSQLVNGLSSPGSNLYLPAEEDALGTLSWDITVPEDVRLTVIFKGR